MSTEIKSIVLKGIENNHTNADSDGSLFDSLNLRPTKTGLRPVGEKELNIAETVGDKLLFVHRTTFGDYYVTYDSSTGEVAVLSPFVAVLSTFSTGTELKFSSLANVLIINNKTEEISFYAFAEQGGYLFFGEHPDLTKLHNSIQIEEGTPPSWTEDLVGISGEEPEDVTTAINKSFYSLLAEDKIIGKIIVTLAFELFDGSVVWNTGFRYLKIGNTFLSNVTYIGSLPGSLQITKLTDDYNDLLTKWNKLIRSVHVYSTEPIPEIKVSNNFSYSDNLVEENDIENEDFSEMLLYKIASIPFIDIINTNAPTYIRITEFKNIQFANTLLRLGVDSNHITLFSNNAFTYNSRLILHDITNKMCQAWKLFIEPASGVELGYTYSLYVEYTLTIDNVDHKILSDTSVPSGFYYKDVHVNVLSYPDTRVKEIKLLLISDGIWYVLDTLAPFYHSFYNIAYYITNQYEVDIATLEQYNVEYNYSITYRDKNRIQFSRLNNPFVFDAANSYRASNGEILAVSSISEPISEGQFGQFPIVAFTSEGIYALNQGSGDVLISTIVPMNSDVLNIEANVAQVPGAIVYTTDEGLKMLSNRNSQLISANIEQFEKEKLSPLADLEEYKLYTNPSAYPNITGYVRLSEVNENRISGETFIQFLAGSTIAYEPVKNELYICNPAYKYTYVFSFEFAAYFKIKAQFRNLINQYNKLIAVGPGTGIIYNLSNEKTYAPNLYQDIFIETNAIVLSDKTILKNIKRAVTQLKAKMNTTQGEESFIMTFSLFASNDDINYQHVATSQRINSFESIGLRNTASFRYYRIIIVGQVSTDSVIQRLDVSYEDKFRNKIR